MKPLNKTNLTVTAKYKNKKSIKKFVNIIWASSRENLSLGFATRYDTNRPARLQRLARILKFRQKKVEVLYYPGSEKQRRWSDCADAQADLRLRC